MNRTFTLGLDLDGVIADYVGVMRRVVAEQTGRDESELTHDTDYHLKKWGITSAEFHRAHAAVVDGRLFRACDLIGGEKTSVILGQLQGAGINIRVVTSRVLLQWQLPNVVEDTVGWLQHHMIPYHELCFVNDKTDIWCDVFIDDAPVKIRRFNEAGMDVIIYDQPWNQESEGPRVYDWETAGKLIQTYQSDDKRYPLRHYLEGLQ